MARIDCGKVVKRYYSKKDNWVVWLIWISIVVLVGSIALVGLVDSWTVTLAWSPFLLGLAAPCLWVLASTYYELAEGCLIIHSGPFSWKIPIVSIRGFYTSRCALSSPALSLDRLRVARRDGRIDIYISPEDKEAFLNELRKLNPIIETDIKLWE